MSSPKRASNKCGMPSCKSKPSRAIAACASCFGFAHCNALRSNFGLDRTLVSRQHWFGNGRGINFCHEFGLATTKSIDKRHHGCGEFSKANPNYSGQSLCFYPPKTSSKRHPVWKLCRFFRVDVFPTNLPYGVSITKAKGTKCWQMTSEDLRFRAENFCTREFFPKMKHQLCNKPLGRRMQTGRWQGPMRSNRCLAAKCLQLFFFYFEAVSRNRMKRSISMNNSRNVWTGRRCPHRSKDKRFANIISVLPPSFFAFAFVLPVGTIALCRLEHI